MRTKTFNSTLFYIKSTEGMKNEVDMWHTGALLFVLEVINKYYRFLKLGKYIGEELRKKLPTISVLDVCCGPGNFANYLSFYYPIDKLNVIGVDKNKQFLEYANKKFRVYGWRFVKADVRKFNLRRKFEFIIASSAYHHIEDKHKVKFLNRINNHLLPNGKIIVCENFLPSYTNKTSKIKAIRDYYSELRKYYLQGNGTPEALSMVEHVYRLELSAKEEYKVSFKRFEKDIKKAGFQIVADKIIWQPEKFKKDNAGSHVLLLKKANAE